jgi:hypothetical protein
VAAAGCSSTVAGQDVPAADTQPDVSPPPGIAVAPDVPGDQPVMIDAGIAVSPDGPAPGISVPPDAAPDTLPNVGIAPPPDASVEPDVFIGADVAPTFGALDTTPSERAPA